MECHRPSSINPIVHLLRKRKFPRNYSNIEFYDPKTSIKLNLNKFYANKSAFQVNEARRRKFRCSKAILV